MTNETLTSLPTLPASPTDRALLLAYIKQVASFLDKIDNLKAEIAEVTGAVTDKEGKLQMKAKDFNSRVKAYREAEKLKDQVASLQEALDDVEVLKAK